MLPRDGYVAANGLRLHYLEWGERHAPPLVLLHGGSAHAHWWDQFAAAVARSYRVLALDLRGHGDSAHPDPPAYRIDNYVRDMVAAVSALHLDRFHLIGHSLGGMVATAFASEHPRHVRALIIVDTQLRVTAAGARYMQRLRNFPQPIFRNRELAIERFRLLPTQTTATPTLLRLVAAHGIYELPDRRWTFKFDREAMAHTEPHDLAPLLRKLTCPILLIRGEHSTLLSPTALATLRSIAPAAAVAEIPRAHHHVMLDNPPAFEHAVRSFLRTVEAQGPTPTPTSLSDP